MALGMYLYRRSRRGAALDETLEEALGEDAAKR